MHCSVLTAYRMATIELQLMWFNDYGLIYLDFSVADAAAQEALTDMPPRSEEVLKMWPLW